MQQLDAVTLRALAAEINTWLDHAKVSKVQHPSAHEFLVTFWGGAPRKSASGGNRDLLYIHLNPELPFAVLCDTRHRQETAIHQFEKPTALCMLLRKHLNGANLLSVETLPGERVLNLHFENFNELGNRVRLLLTVELMGKHSNMMLVDTVQGHILAVAHGVSERMSSHRELAAGLPYAPPPRPPGKRLLTELTTDEFIALWRQKPPEEDSETYLNRHLAGFGLRMLEDAFSAADLKPNALDTSDIDPKALYRRLLALAEAQDLWPATDNTGEAFTLLEPANKTHWRHFEFANDMAAGYCLGRLQTLRVARKRQQLLLVLEQQLKKLQRREKELVPVDEDDIEALQATGDRLLAAVSAREAPESVPSHQGRVDLTHYDTGTPWPIEIDPSLSWVENAQLYYRRAKKAKARRDVYRQMYDALSSEEDYLQTLRQMVTQAENMPDLLLLEADITAAGYGKAANTASATGKTGKAKGTSGKKAEAEPTGVLRLHSSDGVEILVGKSGHGNEAIVGKLSRSDDIWLHVHQMPGSHVLIRSASFDISGDVSGEASGDVSGDAATSVPNQTLLEAAMLAVFFSSAKDSLNVPVIYTQAKFVRKIPGSYPGHVNYRQEQTVFITPEAALVGRLLESAGGRSAATAV